jgi:hypothetical protein
VKKHHPIPSKPHIRIAPTDTKYFDVTMNFEPLWVCKGIHPVTSPHYSPSGFGATPVEAHRDWRRQKKIQAFQKIRAQRVQHQWYPIQKPDPGALPKSWFARFFECRDPNT